MSKKRIIFAAIALVVVVAALIALWWFTRPETTEGQKTFTVTVVHADGSSKEFTYTTDKEYVGQVLMDEGLVQGTQETYGLYMKVVDGERAVYEETGTYWAFFEGEEYAQLGIDQTPVVDGAAYKLVYTMDVQDNVPVETQS